jgi:hypothetical protein
MKKKKSLSFETKDALVTIDSKLRAILALHPVLPDKLKKELEDLEAQISKTIYEQ